MTTAASAGARARRPDAFDAVVLAGGRASRLGGLDKPALLRDGVPLGQRALDAVHGARAIAYVADAAPSGGAAARLRVAVEAPRWSGPVAAIAAGLARLADRPAPVTVVLAGDLVSPEPAVARILWNFTDAAADGVIAVDPSGRRQPLLSAYRTPALVAAVHAVLDAASGASRGPSLRAVTERLALGELRLPAAWCADVDTPADAERHGIVLPEQALRGDRVA